jgi:hypothetical protein
MAEIFTIVINRDDLNSISGSTSLTPYQATYPINLYGGSYTVRLVNFAYNDGLSNSALGSHHSNIYISSSRFNFPIQVNNAQLVFSNRPDNQVALENMKWKCNNPMGQIDISMYIQQFTDSTYVKNNSALWSATNLISVVLTLAFEPIN